MQDNTSPFELQSNSDLSIIEDVMSSFHSSSNPPTSHLMYNDNNFQQKLEELNLQGLIHYQNQDFSQALLFFTQCEKTLENMVSSGSSIDRNHIITILHNQAATFQVLNDTVKASRYVQVIISNLRNFLHSQEHIQIINKVESFLQKPLRKDFNAFIQEKYQLIRQYLSNMFALAQYYLQLSGLSSLNQLHKESLDQAQKALGTIKEVCLRCYQIQSLQDRSQPGISLLKELSELQTQLRANEFQTIYSEFTKMSSMFPDNNQLYHNLFGELPLQSKLQLQQISIHSLFDLTPKSLSQTYTEYSPSSNHYRFQMCCSYYHHLKKVITMMNAYFAVSVELEEIETINSRVNQYDYSSAQYSCKQNKKQAEMMLLNALNLSYKYLPIETQLSRYLLQLYQNTYPKQTYIEGMSPVASLKMESSQPVEHEKQIIQEIYKDYFVDEGSQSTKDHDTMKMNLNLLNQKYQKYMKQKEISLEDQLSGESITKNIENWKQESLKRSMKASIKSSQEFKKSSNWEEQKKESKKLTELFSTEDASNCPNTLLKPNFLGQIPSINSISMANSSLQQQYSISHQGITTKTDHCFKQPSVINEIKVNESPTAFNKEKQENGYKRVHFGRSIKTEIKSSRKSKSTKIIKSKSREHKDNNHRMGMTQRTIQSTQQVPETESIGKKRRGQKSISKNKKSNGFKEIGMLLMKQKDKNGLTHGTKLSKGVKSAKFFNDTSIIFKKVKSPTRKFQGIKQKIKHGNCFSKTSKTTRNNNIELLTSMNQKPSKSKSRNKIARQIPKKQTKSKSISSKKSHSKFMKTNKPCIYTSGPKKR